jgi:molybdopterin/thiamine biosynthesis adenylyltransferase
MTDDLVTVLQSPSSAQPANDTVRSKAYHARHAGVLDADIMASKRVLLLGDGSLGSLIAGFLVRAGIGAIEHHDNDAVDIANISRTLYREEDIGRPKVEALDDILRGIRTDVELESHCGDIAKMDDDVLIAAINRADIVIAATDHPATQARTAALSYWRKPALLPGVYERGTGGEVVYTIPDLTACWHCVFGGIRTEEQPDRGQPDYGVPTGQLRAVPALGCDIANVAVHAARLAIALLQRWSGLDIARIVTLDRNVLFIGNTVDWAFTEPCENFWARTIRRPDCPVCSTDNRS